MIATQPSPGIGRPAPRAGLLAKLRQTAPTSRVMVVAVMVSMVAFLDSTVVNLALPATQRDLGGGLCLQQWVVDGYLLAMAAAILPGGSISDLFGRVPVMRFGLAAFGCGSVVAATAASPVMLISGRVVQGLGAAFLVPGSLAMINSTFAPADRHKAIGTWTGWTGTAFAIGPLLGGLAVDLLSWRWIYALSAVPIVIGFALTFWLRPVPRPTERAPLDVRGAVLAAIGLAATVDALIEAGQHGWSERIVATLIVGIAAVPAFVSWQRRAAHPLIPLRLFAVHNFAAANLVTAFVYGAIAMASLAVALYTQEVAGYCATVAALATLPNPVLSFLFARRVGALAARIGPRVFLTTGPILAGLGLLLIRPGHGFNIVTHLLPGTTVLAIGLLLTTTPLGALNLSSVDAARSGIAAAVQNAVGRTSALTAVASVGLIAAGRLTDVSFARLLQIAAALFFMAAVIATVRVVNPRHATESVTCVPADPGHVRR
ncbi:MFS transporter [Mycobacterium sp. Aquia_213]|uniref:MFS transporter n=1 Tax=Mycobacterium sp. Aquia_213 TaxID=2991728 RepID=UPI002271D935|nr:MFS transporter [Mycobacterium sp. Aquia_213]WAC91032.1 MFS transporter [Mycobacterium sp. Aquia_213]